MQTTIPATTYNLDEEEEKKLILREYRALLRALKQRIKKGDKAMLRRAFEIAADAHRNTRRKSGEPYILHPLAVARIVVEEVGLGVTSAVCALLHDVVEDTELTLDVSPRSPMSSISRPTPPCRRRTSARSC
jgi:guanosine-3',5'-bis(diphosphate) 3'-pyrophosphohydrolase